MIIDDFVFRLGSNYEIVSCRGESFWDLDISIRLQGKLYRLKQVNDPEEFATFGKGLSKRSKDLFCPFPWDEPDKANLSFTKLINNHAHKRDLAYFIYDEHKPIGLLFLLNFKKNNSLVVPELGIGVIDKYQGRGLGKFGMRVLTEVVVMLGVDAVELTTDLSNEVAKNLYESLGYILTGTILNPLEVDQTKDVSVLSRQVKYREEYQMVKVFKNEEAVLKKLEAKRKKQLKVFKRES